MRVAEANAREEQKAGSTSRATTISTRISAGALHNGSANGSEAEQDMLNASGLRDVEHVAEDDEVARERALRADRRNRMLQEREQQHEQQQQQQQQPGALQEPQQSEQEKITTIAEANDATAEQLAVADYTYAEMVCL